MKKFILKLLCIILFLIIFIITIPFYGFKYVWHLGNNKYLSFNSYMTCIASLVNEIFFL